MVRPDGYTEMTDTGYVPPAIPGGENVTETQDRTSAREKRSSSFRNFQPASLQPVNSHSPTAMTDEEEASPTTLEGGDVGGTSFWAFLAIELSCVLFVMFFNTQAVLVKVMNRQWVVLPWTIALWFTAAWPLGFAIEFGYCWVTKKRPRPLSWLFVRNMGILGVIDAVHYAILSWSLNFLPVSTYMILKTSSLVFNLVLSATLLQKNIWKVPFMFAGFFTVACVVFVMFEDNDKDPLVTPKMHYVSCGFSVASALLGSVHVALSQRLLKGVLNTGKFRGLMEYVSYNGMISFFVLLPFPFIFGEYKEWKDDIFIHATMVLCVVGLSVSKLFAIICKFIVAKNTSALISGTLDLTRRVGVVVVAVTLFGESFALTKILALATMAIALLCYIYGARNKETDSLQALLSPMPASPRNRMSVIKAAWTAINEPEEQEMPVELMESLLANQALTSDETQTLTKALNTPFF